MKTILFICTGNTCRSPMAEAIAQRWLDEQRKQGGEPMLAASAGVAAAEGMPPTREGLDALARIGIEHAGRSKPVTPEMLRSAQVVFCMTESHLQSVLSMLEHDELQHRKVMLLDPTGNIEDPIGLGQEAYDALVTCFQTLIPERIREVLLHEDRLGIGSPRL